MNDLSTRLTLDGSDFNRGMDSATSKVKELNDEAKKTSGSIKDLGNNGKKSVKDLLNEMKQISGQERSVSNYRRQLSQITRDIQDLTINYAAMTKEMQNSDVGQQTILKINELTQQAGKYKDAILDAQKAINNVASDTANWDAVKMGINTVSSALQGVVSAGILGKKSTEDLVAVITKLKGIEAATNAVIQVGNALQKQSALMMGISNLQAKALAKAKTLEAAATGKATVAQTAFNAVAKANPYVLLASAVLAVISALVIFNKRTKEAGEASKTAAGYQERYNKALNEAKSSVGSTLSKFSLLQAQYKALKTEAEKTQWIKDNKKNFDDLNLAVTDVNSADDIFIKNAGKVIQAMKLRAEVAAMMATYEEQYAEAYKESLKTQEGRANSFAAGGTIKKEWKDAGLKVGEDISQHTTTIQSTVGATNWTTYSLTEAGAQKLRDYYKNLGEDVIKNFEAGADPAIQEMNKKMAQALALENETGAFKKNEPDGGSGGKKNKEEEDKLKNAKSQLIILEAQKKELEEQRYLYEEGSEGYKDWLSKLNDIENKIKKIKEEEAQLISLMNRPQLPQLEKIDSSQLFKNQTITINIDPNIKRDKLVERFKEAEDEVSKIKGWVDLGLIGKQEAQKLVDEINKKLKDIGVSKALSLDVDIKVNDDSIKTIGDKLRDTVDNLDRLGGSTSGIVGSINSVYEALKGLGDKLEDAENGWESFMAVFETGMTIFSGVANVIEAIATFTDLMTQAKNRNTQAIQKNTAASAAEATQAGVTAAAKTGEAAISGASAAAKGGESVASIPYVGAFMAIAMIGTIMATIMSVISMAKGFATGGVVGGNSFTGDKILARLNSGELILNQDQQNKLWGAINSPTIDSQSNRYEFVIHGQDLVAIQSNYNRKMSQI